MPLHYRKITNLHIISWCIMSSVSFYAFFKGWLLPSLPPEPDISFFFFLLNRQLSTLDFDLGCFPFDISPLRDYVWIAVLVILYLKVLKTFLLLKRFCLKITLPQNNNHFIITEIIFAENQLSLALISLSPLITSHPRILQHSRVQSSVIFDLLIIRSTSFGSNESNFRTFSQCLFYN